MLRSASRARTAASATGRPRRDFAAEPPGVDLRLDAKPRVQVVIGARAMRAISEETVALSRDFGVESGGWIFGRVAFRWDTRVEVSFVTGPGAKAKHAPDWCALDYELCSSANASSTTRGLTPAISVNGTHTRAAGCTDPQTVTCAPGRSAGSLSTRSRASAANDGSCRAISACLSGRARARAAGQRTAAADGVDRPGRAWSCRLRASHCREEVLKGRRSWLCRASYD